MGQRGEEVLVAPSILFSWFEGYPRPPRAVAHFLAPVMVGCLLCGAAGRLVRPALLTFCLLYAYTIGLVLSDYNNHHYLYWLIALMFAACGAINAQVPAWVYSLFRFQILVVYLFAAVAKLNLDWLRGLPLGLMLEARGWPNPHVALSVSWAGLLIDLILPPALLWKKTRKPAAIGLTAFHLGNAFLFEIATFPFFMIASLILFFPPPCESKFVNPSKAVKLVILVWCSIQILIPLRHHLLPGDVNWDRRGHRLSWRMMLNVPRGQTVYQIEYKDGRKEVLSPPYTGLNSNQVSLLQFEPEFIKRYGAWLADQPGVERVYILTHLSLNGRSPRSLLAPDSNNLEPSPEPLEPWPLKALQLLVMAIWLKVVGGKLYSQATDPKSFNIC